MEEWFYFLILFCLFHIATSNAATAVITDVVYLYTVLSLMYVSMYVYLYAYDVCFVGVYIGGWITVTMIKDWDDEEKNKNQPK